MNFLDIYSITTLEKMYVSVYIKVRMRAVQLAYMIYDVIC